MRALVLSGGGRRGAFQVGALQHLMLTMGMQFDIITGTSVGALNGAFLAQYKIGNEDRAVSDLTDLWDDITTKRIYRRWYYGLMGRLPVVLPSWLGGQLSVYCTAPLQRMVRTRLDADAIANSGKKLRIGAVDLATGYRKVWSEHDSRDIADAVLASSAFPVAFEPIEIDGQLYTDAGLVEQTPVEDAIDAGADEITVIMTSAHGQSGLDGHPSGIDLAVASLTAMGGEIERWDLKVVELHNALLSDGKRHVKVNIIRPTIQMGDSLDFSQDLIQRDIDHGRKVAQTA